MRLKIMAPFEIFAEIADVTRVIAETRDGSFALLPRRRDCVAALSPGILTYETGGDGVEKYVAVDEGILVKNGADVMVSVHNAIGGDDLSSLRAAVDKRFLEASETEKSIREVLAKLDTAFVHRFAGLGHA